MAKASVCVLGLACFVVVFAVAGATQYTVGGANGWSVPAAGAEAFNTWAMRTRFQISDSLLFVYPKDQDSVMLVEPADYNSCNTSSYVRRFDDGDTVFTLDRSGPLFFISGVYANCRANEKLIVMVLAAGRSNGTGGAPAPNATTPPPVSPSPPPASPITTPPPSSSPAPKAPTAASPPAATSSAPTPPAAASVPTTTPSTPPPASSPPAPSSSSPAPVSSTSPSAPQTPPPAPSASAPAPSAHGTTANSTGTPSSPPAGSKDKSGAAVTVATGLAGSIGACILGYAMFAL